MRRLGGRFKLARPIPVRYHTPQEEIAYTDLSTVSAAKAPKLTQLHMYAIVVLAQAGPGVLAVGLPAAVQDVGLFPAAVRRH